MSSFLGVADSIRAAQTTDDPDEPIPAASILSKAIRRVADRAAPSLVRVYALRGPRMTMPWRLREASKRHDGIAESGLQYSASSLINSPDDQGSGIIIDGEGYILTCSHVVDGANTVFVRTSDGRKIFAEQVWSDPATDLGVIRLKNANNLKSVELGNSDNLAVGDWVVSLASPYDLENSLSAGIVTTTKRWISSSPHPMIQNDAATNPGSSGGALFNLQGEVIGIIVGGFSTASEFQGIGLATPINTAKVVVEQLRTRGHVQRGQFGFDTQSLTPEMASLLESSVDAGLYVKDVQPDSPAGRAGLREGDVITMFDGDRIDRTFDPQSLTADSTPGRKHTISLLREHKTVQFELEMRQSSPQVAATTERAPPPTESFEHYDSVRGLGLSHLELSVIRELELPEDTHGALVTYVAFDSDAYREGIAAGMVIARINDRAVESIGDYQEICKLVNPDKPLLMLLHSNRGKHLVMLSTH